MPPGQGLVTTCAIPCTFQASALEAGKGRQEPSPTRQKREIPRTQAVARHNKRPQTIMALISRVQAPMLGATNKLFRPNARDPQEHDSIPGRLVSVYPWQATHVLFTKWTHWVRMTFQRKTNWKYWIKYIKPIWCPQHHTYIQKYQTELHICRSTTSFCQGFFVVCVYMDINPINSNG